MIGSRDLQRHIYMSKPVVRLELKNTTPLLVGWYDPSKQDPVGIRATEIKGIWRWWCRAFIAGAMYDTGMLSGIEGRDVYLAPSKEEAEAISCIVGKILGLGYAGEKPAESSRFKLTIQAEGNLRKLEFRRDQVEYQRIKLLTLKDAVEGIEQGHRFTLSVEKVREKYKDAEELALKILIVSLQLSGVGKGGRRGLGSLDITHIDSEDVLSSVDRDIAKFIKDVYEKSIEIVDNRKYQEICGVKSNKQASNKVLLPLPAVSKEDFKLYKVDARGYRDFVQVHQFFVRTERCRALYGEKICRDDLRKNLDAWFLGLPREQKGTGYRSDHDSRRASPILVTYHSEKNIFRQGIFVSVFLSGDWPKELKWVGGGKKPVPIEIDADKIKKARNVFIDEFVKYLMQKRLRLQEIRWY
ncbi:MAG: type III-B CRISPR module RAMP protein Cmr1 [Desulfurococcaceae archaeon]